MKFLTYLRDSALNIVYFFSILLIINLVLISSTPLSKTINEIIYMDLLIIITSIIFLIIGFLKWKANYKEFKKALDNKKDLDIVLPVGQNLESELIRDTIKLKNIEMNTKIKSLKKENDELNDYITKWIHEIKIPISVGELIAERIDAENKLVQAKEISSGIRNELERIKFLTNQVLYASRASSYSEDLLINEINLEKVVKEVIKKNSYTFISRKIDLELGNLNFNIMSDKKWLSYIIDQILNNSYKYVENDGEIKIYAKEEEKTIHLTIEDNGIGILSQDLSRVFDKGFTGNNGRKIAKSTGMGLYYSNKMAEKLNHRIEIDSKENQFTCVTIIFYKLADYYKVTKM